MLAAALGLSYRTALGLVGETLELCYRLPRLWALVQSGALQAWKARQVARTTTCLSAAAVDFVDRHLAVTGARNHLPGNLASVITTALNRCDPDLAEGREEAALAHRHVTFDYSRSTETGATAELTATLDILDALDLDTTITGIATTMGHLGDTTPLGVRRAHALGMLADPQHTLNIFSQPDGDGDGSGGGKAGVSTGVGGRLNSTAATLYLHITAADLTTGTGPAGGGPGGSAGGCGGDGVRVEKLDATTLTVLHDWLQRTDRVTIRPVLDPSRSDAVDQHDPPEWMRETVTLRDQHCVFPGCGIDARSCDQDHITPYRDPADGGPPGQTNPGNLACLCRRHHRLKTRGTWTYHRTPDQRYSWTSPHGHTYTTSPGTRPDRR